MEKRTKRSRSTRPGSALDAGSRARKKPWVEGGSEKKKGTTMTKAKRTRFCILLQSLMSHPYGEVFNNMETLKEIRPESFIQLVKPMDLEIVKTMLDNNLYFTVEDFAEDVRTTFSNAMQIFPATNDVHRMAIKLSDRFESGFKNKVDSLNPEPKPCRSEPKTCSPEPKKCNDLNVYEKKEIHGKKTDPPSSRESNLAAASSAGEKVHVGRPEINRKKDLVFVAGTYLVKGTEDKSFKFTVVPGATKRSSAPMTPRRAARVAAFIGRFDEREKRRREVQEQRTREREDLEGMEKTIHLNSDHEDVKEFERVIGNSEGTETEMRRLEEMVAEVRVCLEEMKGSYPNKAQLNEKRKREREALERMENTAQFGADHRALREFEWLLAHPELRLADYSIRFEESTGEDVSAEELEEGEIPSSPPLLRWK